MILIAGFMVLAVVEAILAAGADQDRKPEKNIRGFFNDTDVLDLQNPMKGWSSVLNFPECLGRRGGRSASTMPFTSGEGYQKPYF
jgi:hypothetical protein